MLGLLLMTVLGGSLYVDPSGVSEAPAAAQFSYDAVEPKGKRKAPAVDHRAEDLILDGSKRAKLTANARDITRNFSIAKWMIRRHLDYVATFDFHMRTGDDELDDEVERKMGRWFRAPNCDRAGRHPFWRMIRLVEMRRTVDGDCGLLKLTTGQLQAIEGDRIRNPGGATLAGDGRNWIHGVKTDPAGRALAYSIHRRKLGAFEFERTVPAGNLCLHGFFDRFDQVRGISPIDSALNPLRDVYENFDYALAKAKVSQLFAMAFYRQATEAAGVISEVETTGDAETAAEESDKPKYKVDFGRGPVQLDLDPGDDVKIIESAQPSSQFQSFTQQVIAVALKALDIPYSFYDESHTNFFGSRAAWLHYDRACMFKRADVLDLLNRLTTWRLVLMVIDGEITLPAGMSIEDLAWEWVPLGMPWWDPAKEINGDLLAIRAGLDNPQRITKDRGKGDWYDNVDQIAKALKYAREHPDGAVPLAFEPIVQPVEVVEREEATSGK